MEPDERRMLKQLSKLAEENNKLLKKIHRSIKWGRFVKLVYWVIVIGSAVGAYYVFQPAFESIQETFGMLGTGVENLQNIGGFLPDFSGLLEGFKSGQ
tara:strand:- start:47 stop:340 length:294 start_codon:yes stop_codon:yes gene_type:complete